MKPVRLSACQQARLPSGRCRGTRAGSFWRSVRSAKNRQRHLDPAHGRRRRLRLEAGDGVHLSGGRVERELNAVFSPDGRWLAYQSDESGRSEVYVRPFPGPGSRAQVSAAGGLAPRWSRTGMELVFQSGDQKLMIAGYSVQGDVFRADKPRPWSDSAFAKFDLHPDGQRAAAIAAVQSPSSSSGQVRVRAQRRGRTSQARITGPLTQSRSVRLQPDVCSRTLHFTRAYNTSHTL